MKLKTLSTFTFGPTVVLYRTDEDSGRVELLLHPAGDREAPVPRREVLSGPETDAMTAAMQFTVPAFRLDSLAQVSVAGEARCGGFSQGLTMRDGPCVDALRLEGQCVERAGKRTVVRTTLRHPAGWRVHHVLCWTRGTRHVEIRCELENASEASVTVEMLASFSIGGMTPYAADDAPHRLRVHRFRSTWSLEGRLETRSMEDLQLENSWASWSVRSERFGAIGSMPVRQWFPFVAVEDTGAGVLWGAHLAHPGSWQMEVYRRGETVALSGGLADREFGHWWKTLAPGERLQTPAAAVACVRGDLDTLCDALVLAQEPAAVAQPASEKTLPVICNEWATSWGRPSHDRAVALARQARKLGARYFVVDAGWYAPPSGTWNAAHGDWIPNAGQFPGGLKATADAIRAEGVVPGLWFEMENCGCASQIFQRTEMLLRRDGQPLTSGITRFLDFRNPATVEYLAERVIGTLRDAGFGYLKVDYNETIGLGADGAESPGEALRQHLGAVQGFFRRIREELPDLVIENCSSGGHRTEPSMVGLTAMNSFSDAHECLEIPIIAANLHRLILPRQSQVWAVMRASDDAHRTAYSLAAGFLGRMCLSGDILDLAPEQTARVKQAVALYRQVAPVIRSGFSRRFGPPVIAYRHPEGWQVVLRAAANGKRALAVFHTFGGRLPRTLEIPLPAGAWRIDGEFHASNAAPEVRGGTLRIPVEGKFRGGVVSLVKG